jgi:3-deoxy-D-arabino-heptulosonate 7-phosphate (DAHP) synthase class II
MAILSVSDRGVLTVVDTLPTVAGAHCVTTDGAGMVYVCDPAHGRLLVLRDSHAP